MSRKNYKENPDNLICKICFNEYQYLGSHIWHKHKIKAKDYKKMFGLDYNLPLMCEKVRKKKQIAWKKGKKKYLKNLKIGQEKFKFKKGKRHRNYFSKNSIKEVTERIKKVNNRKKEICPVCNMKFKNLDSHLYNKHKLIRVR